MNRMNQLLGRRGRRGPVTVVAVLAAASMVLAGCGGSTSDDDASGLTTVTLAMDYYPGSTHTGLAYAIQSGLFEKQGIKVKLISYNGATAAEPIVASGKADLGIGTNSSLDTELFATGAKVTSIFMISPGSATHLSVLKSSGITSPSQLVGKTYGGYGDPFEEALVNQMITTDGGSGKVKQIVLTTGTYEALKAGKVDTAVTYPEDDYQLGLDGKDIVSFKPADYGVPAPAMSGAMILANNSFLDKHPELAKKFTTALRAGYEKAIADPAAAADALASAFPDAKINEKLVQATTPIYAKESFPNPYGAIGAQSTDDLQVAADWLIDQGLLVDGAGESLKTFDVSPYISNDYLP